MEFNYEVETGFVVKVDISQEKVNLIVKEWLDTQKLSFSELGQLKENEVAKKIKPNRNVWTEADKHKLMRLKEQGVSDKDISEELSRTENSVRSIA